MDELRSALAAGVLHSLHTPADWSLLLLRKGGPPGGGLVPCALSATSLLSEPATLVLDTGVRHSEPEAGRWGTKAAGGRVCAHTGEEDEFAGDSFAGIDLGPPKVRDAGTQYRAPRSLLQHVGSAIPWWLRYLPEQVAIVLCLALQLPNSYMAGSATLVLAGLAAVRSGTRSPFTIVARGALIFAFALAAASFSSAGIRVTVVVDAASSMASVAYVLSVAGVVYNARRLLTSTLLLVLNAVTAFVTRLSLAG